MAYIYIYIYAYLILKERKHCKRANQLNLSVFFIPVKRIKKRSRQYIL